MSEREMPQTLSDWIEFMNGYRDPKSVEELRKDREAYEDFIGERFASSGSGARECGNRKEGGTYATCPLSKYGKPLEHFVICKPVHIVADDYNLSNVGVKLVDVEELCLTCKGVAPVKKAKQKYQEACRDCDGTGTETVTHVFDIVGQEYYPNVADFLEEARRLGVSRRLELEDSRQYARLSKRSRLMLLHHRAIIDNPLNIVGGMGYYEILRYARASCPKSLTEHDLSRLFTEEGGTAINPTAPGCSALYWNILEGATEIPESIPVYGTGQKTKPIIPSYGFVERRLVSGTYRGYGLKPDIKPEYALGIFAVFPLVTIQVVDPEDNYPDALFRAGKARLDVEKVEC